MSVKFGPMPHAEADVMEKHLRAAGLAFGSGPVAPGYTQFEVILPRDPEVARLGPVVRAAQAWVGRIIDPPAAWADEDDLALINAVKALEASHRVGSQ